MGIISVIITLIFLIIGLIYNRKILHPLNLFNLVWFLILTISLCHYEGMYLPSDSIFLMALVAVVLFNLGGMIAYRVKIKTNSRFCAEFGIQYKERIYFIVICIIVVLAVHIILSLRAFQYFKNVPAATMASLRYEFFYGNAIIKNIWESLFFNYVITGIKEFLTFYMLLSFFKPNKDFKRIAAILLIMITDIFFTGGRTIIVTMFIILLILIIINWKKMSKKSKLFLLSFMLCLVATGIVISVARNVPLYDVVNQIIVYFVGPLPFSSQVLSTYEIEMLYMGRVFFASLFDFIINTLRFFNLTELVSAAIMISDLTRESLVIMGNGGTFNALVPFFFDFYLEGGFFAIVIYSAVYGFICTYIYRKQKKNPHRGKYEMLNLILLLSIIYSVRGWYFMPVWTLTMLIFVNLYEKKVKPRSEGQCRLKRLSIEKRGGAL